MMPSLWEFYRDAKVVTRPLRVPTFGKLYVTKNTFYRLLRAGWDMTYFEIVKPIKPMELRHV